MAYKKILVCLDGSPLAEAALAHAQILASDEEAEIVLLRVSANPAAEFSFSDPTLAHHFITVATSSAPDTGGQGLSSRIVLHPRQSAKRPLLPRPIR